MSVIVTLTTDLGTKDFYTGLIKGSILSKRGWINIVDITHDIKNYDIVHGAFVLKNVYNSFPKGSIHIIWVDDSQEPAGKCLIFEHDGYFFIGPDNGLFTLMFDPLPSEIYKLELKPSGTFAIGNLIPSAIDEIVSQKKLSEIGIRTNDITKRFAIQPVVTETQIRGTIVHIDSFENAIVNIKRDLFDKVRAGRKFSIFFKRYDPIMKIHKYYTDVAIGDIVCLFNASGNLEISINKGKAASLLGLEVDDSVQIDFE